MAHTYLLTCANYRDSAEWAHFMRTQCSGWNRESLDNCECGQPFTLHPIKNAKEEIVCSFIPKKVTTECQWNLKPIQLWELITPKEAVPEVMYYNKIPLDKKEQVDDKQLKYIKFGIQKALGLKDMPIIEKGQIKIRPRLIQTDSMRIYALGYKEDEVKDFDFGVEGKWRQEGL